MAETLKRCCISPNEMSTQARAIGSPPFPPQLLTDAIEDGLPQVREQRSAVARLEVPDPLERLKQGFVRPYVLDLHLKRFGEQ